MEEGNLSKQSNYQIVIDNFEGPLDVLVFLITKNKMDIFSVSLSELTDNYIDYLNKMAELNLDIASEFIVMAATLLDIKAKKLLPSLEDKQQDEVTEEEMIARILEYKKYKEMSEVIQQLYLNHFGTCNKPYEKINFKKKVAYTGEQFNKFDLYDIYHDMISRNQNKMNTKAKEIEKLALYERITVKDKARQIISYLKENDKLVFNDIFNVETVDNIEVVTAFLSSLELSKLKQVSIEQRALFTDIYIRKNLQFDQSYEFKSVSLE